MLIVKAETYWGAVSSVDRRWRNSEASGDGARAESLVPDSDDEICGADSKFAREAYCVGSAEPVTYSRAVKLLREARSRAGDGSGMGVHVQLT